MLAASVAAAVMVGVVTGMAMGAIIVTPARDRSAIAERDTMQKTIAALREDVAILKADVAAAEKSTIATAEKPAEHLAEPADITGSISLPSIDAPLPAPRPAIAARPQLVRGWWISSVREGLVYVQGAGGIFQVQPGAPLPGLGPVQAVALYDGHWAVRTPEGFDRVRCATAAISSASDPVSADFKADCAGAPRGPACFGPSAMCADR